MLCWSSIVCKSYIVTLWSNFIINGAQEVGFLLLQRLSAIRALLSIMVTFHDVLVVILTLSELSKETDSQSEFIDGNSRKNIIFLSLFLFNS